MGDPVGDKGETGQGSRWPHTESAASFLPGTLRNEGLTGQDDGAAISPLGMWSLAATILKIGRAHV